MIWRLKLQVLMDVRDKPERNFQSILSSGVRLIIHGFHRLSVIDINSAALAFPRDPNTKSIPCPSS